MPKNTRRVHSKEERERIIEGAKGLRGQDLYKYLENLGVAQSTFLRWKHERNLERSAIDGSSDDVDRIKDAIRSKAHRWLKLADEL